MRKPDKKEHINLLFSAFLVIAFIICANFFAKSVDNMSVLAGRLVIAGVYAVFGVLLFFATRIGEGKPIMRFSPFTLCVMVIPSLFIVIASLFDGMILHDFFMPKETTVGLSVIASLASVAFGYGVLYTVFSGFELEAENEEEEYYEEDEGALEGGGFEYLSDSSEDYEDDEEDEDDTDEDEVMRRYNDLV